MALAHTQSTVSGISLVPGAAEGSQPLSGRSIHGTMLQYTLCYAAVYIVLCCSIHCTMLQYTLYYYICCKKLPHFRNSATHYNPNITQINWDFQIPSNNLSHPEIFCKHTTSEATNRARNITGHVLWLSIRTPAFITARMIISQKPKQSYVDSSRDVQRLKTSSDSSHTATQDVQRHYGQ